MASRAGPKERVLIEQVRLFLDSQEYDHLTNFVLTPALQFEEPIIDLGVGKLDLLTDICDENVIGSSVENVLKKIQSEKNKSPIYYDEGKHWWSIGGIEVRDFSFTYIKAQCIPTVQASGLLTSKKVYRGPVSLINCFD